jgi:ornithine racemase
MYGIMPSNDKMVQLSLYKQIIELNSTVRSNGFQVDHLSLFPLSKKKTPKGINHFRIGETLFFGNNLVTGKTIKGMKDDVITLYAEIIELLEKPLVPEGELGENPSGETFEIDPADYGKLPGVPCWILVCLIFHPIFLYLWIKILKLPGQVPILL